MTDQRNSQVLLHARLQQADTAFEAGQLLRESGFYSDCVNRFYYSMFYAVMALLITQQLGTSKHKGAISLFDREFVKPGIFPKEMSVWLHSIFEQRLEADYADLSKVTHERAIEIESQADSFIQAVKKHVSA
ncbi:MAG: HEPN domain-containing protein [Cyanobacteria bacterium J06555_13]